LNEDSYKDSTLIMQLLRDNLTVSTQYPFSAGLAFKLNPKTAHAFRAAPNQYRCCSDSVDVGKISKLTFKAHINKKSRYAPQSH